MIQRAWPGRGLASERGLDAAQRWLFARVTRPLGSAAPARDDARWVASSDAWPSSDRIGIYQRGYFSRLVECLRDDYPAVEHAAGHVDFEALCLRFIEAHPPACASLNFFGAPFAGFCAACAATPAPFMSELARLEWAVVECIHADAERTLDPRDLVVLSEDEWPRVRLVPSSASRILATSYPVASYYRAFLRGEAPAPPAIEPCTIAVSRRGDDVYRLEIEPCFAPLLECLAGGEPLAAALAAVSREVGPSSASDLQRTLAEWVSCGLFAGVRLD